jgi:hypothetical protein
MLSSRIQLENREGMLFCLYVGYCHEANLLSVDQVL